MRLSKPTALGWLHYLDLPIARGRVEFPLRQELGRD